VTLAGGAALAGLLLLAPLVLLHLRDRSRDVREVPSLLLWRELAVVAAPGRRRLRPPLLPLLLALQALGLVLLVLALAEPGRTGRASTTRVVVLDDSYWMAAPGRMALAVRDAERFLRAGPPGARARVVLAGADAAVVDRGDIAGALAALAAVRPSAAPADLAAGLTLAGGVLTGPGDRILVLRAPEDPLPPTRAAPAELQVLPVGSPLADQGIFDASARCGFGTGGLCAVTATMRNTAPYATTVHYRASVPGRAPLQGSAQVPGASSRAITLLAREGEQVELSLVGAQGLAIDKRAWVTVPDAGGVRRAATVTLVGMPSRAATVARAFAALPGVRLRLLTPAAYRPALARSSDLIVLDDWLPPSGLPPSPGLFLVDPPRLPGGRAGPLMTDTTLSGTDAGNPLLADVDLSSLTIDPGAARRLTLPRWLAPVAWSPEGTLLAAGDDGRRRLVVASFEPGRSDLPQLPALPVLAANVVSWTLGWIPISATAGTPIALDATPGARFATLSHDGSPVARARLHGRPASLTAPAPGLDTIGETGPGVERRRAVAVNLAAAGGAPAGVADLRPPGTAGEADTGLAAWFLAAALVALALEWAYWTSRRRATT
jgi:hypothetical protein